MSKEKIEILSFRNCYHELICVTSEKNKIFIDSMDFGKVELKADMNLLLSSKEFTIISTAVLFWLECEPKKQKKYISIFNKYVDWCNVRNMKRRTN